jgi:cell division protein FtsB
MKWFTAALGIVVLLLQYRLWMSHEGVQELGRLEKAVQDQRLENESLVSRNTRLAAEVRDLKKGVTALEERARSDLGMISGNETFYQVIPPRGKDSAGTAAPPTRTAAR